MNIYRFYNIIIAATFFMGLLIGITFGVMSYRNYDITITNTMEESLIDCNNNIQIIKNDDGFNFYCAYDFPKSNSDYGINTSFI